MGLIMILRNLCGNQLIYCEPQPGLAMFSGYSDSINLTLATIAILGQLPNPDFSQGFYYGAREKSWLAFDYKL